MTTQHGQRLAEALEACRPVPPAKPNILKTLLAVQSALGHVPTSGIPQIAQVLGVTDAQVAGVLSYYSDLRTQSPGRHLIRVCMGESCTANHGGPRPPCNPRSRARCCRRHRTGRAVHCGTDVLRGKLRGVADRDDR